MIKQKLTAKNRSVLEGRRRTSALMVLRAFSWSPLSRTCEISPFCHVLSRCSISFASQFWTQFDSPSPRMKDWRSGYLTETISTSVIQLEMNTHCPPTRYSCSLNHLRILSQIHCQQLCVLPHSLTINPCQNNTSKCSDTMVGGRGVVTILKIFGCHESGLWTFQDARPIYTSNFPHMKVKQLTICYAY